MSDTAIYRKEQRRRALVAATAAHNALAGLVGYGLPTVPVTAAATAPGGLSRSDLTTAA